MTGKYVYWTILFTVAASFAWGILMDLVLMRLNNDWTISDWLRENILWFWIPAGMMVLAIVLLGLHLYKLLGSSP